MHYRCEAASVAGFIQQLAVGYLARGYVFYVAGEIPSGKDPHAVDEKLIEKYGIVASRATRARRKALGLANVQYLRYRRSFLLVATPGKHRLFEDEADMVRDARETPMKFLGYALSYRAGHPHVRIEQRQYLELKAYFLELALHRQVSAIEEEFRKLHYEPYAPVRGQLFALLRALNRKRRVSQFEPVSSRCIRVRRRIVCPFQEDSRNEEAA